MSVVNNSNIWTEPHFFIPNQTTLIPDRIGSFFFKNRTKTKQKFKKSILHIPNCDLQQASDKHLPLDIVVSRKCRTCKNRIRFTETEVVYGPRV